MTAFTTAFGVLTTGHTSVRPTTSEQAAAITESLVPILGRLRLHHVDQVATIEVAEDVAGQLNAADTAGERAELHGRLVEVLGQIVDSYCDLGLRPAELGTGREARIGLP